MWCMVGMYGTDNYSVFFLIYCSHFGSSVTMASFFELLADIQAMTEHYGEEWTNGSISHKEILDQHASVVAGMIKKIAS